MAPVITYLLNNAPWIAVIVLAIIGSWKLSKYHAKLEETRNKVDSLPCDKHKDGIRDSEQRYNELQRIVTSTNDMVVEINKWLMKFDNDMIDKLAKKASPLKMTPLGEVLFEKSSAKKTIDNNIDFLIKELEDINPQTAYDVEDQGKGICFCTYCYNVQPGVAIDYATGDSHLNGKNDQNSHNSSAKEHASAVYILNTNTKKFHKPDCYSVKQMSSKNRKKYKGLRKKLIKDGYSPCKNCNP